ncbi:precorrin-4 C(11)-methyltransferase [Lachnospiraceae bacterium NSJ-143]|nr:precorrin-4 C(11)-methyltransferase [Lachnospiraceae bacterium NSJ-143]
MVNFVGAGPGAPDLITLRGKKLLSEADVIIYAGSLVNKELLNLKKESCKVYNSAYMTLEAVTDIMADAENNGLMTVRLHTGDPSVYGAIREQMDILDEKNIQYSVCPGVSSFCAAAAALNIEYTLPAVSQTVIITRVEGRTPVPSGEDLSLLASHRATMVLFLSTGLIRELTEKLYSGGISPNTPAAIVYKASWNDERKIICTVKELYDAAKKNGIENTAIIIIGDVLNCGYERSCLYNPSFTTMFRKGENAENE